VKISKVTIRTRVQWGTEYSEADTVTLEAEINEGEDIREVLNQLRLESHQALPNRDKFIQSLEQYDHAKKRMAEINQKLVQAENTWTAAAKFMKAQGLNANAPEFPKLPQLPQVVDAELDEF